MLTNRFANLLSAGAALLVAPLIANAGVVTFNATGDPDVFGFVQFDDAFFPGFVSNSHIVGLSITAFGAGFALGDVHGGETIIDSSGVIPIIVNGAGFFAENGTASIAFYPDGYGGTASDGDASLAFRASFLDPLTFHAVRWEAAAPVPEPATFVLLAVALACLGFSRRRKRR